MGAENMHSNKFQGEANAAGLETTVRITMCCGWSSDLESDHLCLNSSGRIFWQAP